MEWVTARHAAFDARDPNLPALHVVERELGCFTAAEAVPVDEIEERPVADIPCRNRPEEPLDLLPREVRERLLSRASILRHFVTAGDSNAFSHKRLFGKAVGNSQSALPCGGRKRLVRPAAFNRSNPEIADACTSHAKPSCAQQRHL